MQPGDRLTLHWIATQGYDLVLPSGARAGHRSLRKYYKQQFAHRENRDSVVIQTLMSECVSVSPRYRK